MIEIKGVTHAEIEPQGVELGDGPDSVDVELRTDDNVILLMRLGEVTIVVVLDSRCDAETEPNWTSEKIVGNLVN